MPDCTRKIHADTAVPKKAEAKLQAHIQGGAEPTDTFQMVIGNIWIQGKICETVYKYVQLCYLLPTDYKLIF